VIAGFLLAAALQALAPAELVVVREPVDQVLVVAGDVRVEGRVTGNVLVVFGDVELSPQAVVEGDLVILGGSALGEGKVQGKTLVLGGQGASSWSLRFVRLGFWLLVSFLLLALAPLSLRRVGKLCGQGPGRNLLGGLAFVLSWLAVAMLLPLLLPSLWWPAVWLVLAGGLLLAKAFGLVGVAWALGKLLRPALPKALRAEFPRTGLGMALLSALSLIPAVGEGFWVLVGLWGLGGVVRWLPAPSWTWEQIRLAMSRPHSRI